MLKMLRLQRKPRIAILILILKKASAAFHPNSRRKCSDCRVKSNFFLNYSVVIAPIFDLSGANMTQMCKHYEFKNLFLLLNMI